MKITKTQLKQIIKEELEEAQAVQYGSATMKPSSPIIINPDGRFNMDVGGGTHTLTGQIDPDVIEELIDDGILKSPVAR